MLLHLQIKPGAKQDAITKMEDGSWKIYIRAQPVDGKANKYLIEYLSNILQVSKSRITIKKGALSIYKTLFVDADEAALLELLNKQL